MYCHVRKLIRLPDSVVPAARDMPDFAEMTPVKATFGRIGAAMMTAAGRQLRNCELRMTRV